jgi:hypothetical protein
MLLGRIGTKISTQLSLEAPLRNVSLSWTALWMREAPPEFDLCWRELAIVAKALADGRDMTEIGLMHESRSGRWQSLATTLARNQPACRRI